MSENRQQESYSSVDLTFMNGNSVFKLQKLQGISN